MGWRRRLIGTALKPGNAGGGRSLSSRQTQDVVKDLEIGRPHNSEQRSETAKTALHAKAKAEPDFRFYATLYYKISPEDILAHAYALCRSNKGAPGVDRQDFEDTWALGRVRTARVLRTAPSGR